MKKIRLLPLSSFLPWLAPLIIKFAVVSGGIEVHLYRNNRLLNNRPSSILYNFLPEPLAKWFDEYHITLGPQPYPVIKQLEQYLLPLASKKLIIDSSALVEFEEVSIPKDFTLVWRINRSLECIEGNFEGADHYLGMGWFQKGTKIWHLQNNPSNYADAQLRSLVVPLQEAKFLRDVITPHMQQYLPTRIDFQLISDFAVQVIVLDARIGRITLALQCNYPQILPIMSVPQQELDVLLANQTIIQFPQQALTPVLVQLLQKNPTITIQGTAVPQFITEQLPVLRQFKQISNDAAIKISQSNTIVPIASLKPTHSIVHTYENGIGRYTMTATYQHLQQTLDMSAFLTARRNNQHFVQQHGNWFEWPYNSHDLANTIQQQMAIQVLRPEEVMGFDTRRTALLYKQPLNCTVKSIGTTPIERSESLFKQLRYHGIPGGIIGEPKGLMAMFVNACENLLRDNRQARILWLAPSNKKGSVTRAVNDVAVSSNVRVASLVTLRDEPSLLSRPWTLVIFQGLDKLLDGSPQAGMLSRLKWEWAITSVASTPTLDPFMMRVLHLSEQYFSQFCVRYLFNVETNSNSEVASQIAHRQNSVRPMSTNAANKIEMPQAAVSFTSAPIRLVPDSMRVIEDLSLPLRTPIQTPPSRSVISPQPIPQSIKLNHEKIAMLHEESEQLMERLSVEQDSQIHLPVIAIPNQVPTSAVAKDTAVPAPELDEDWQIILQQWRPEHLEGISLLYQGKSEQLTELGRKVRRPVSQLIDEINTPVDQQIGDLLVDPETLALSPHLSEITEKLVHWYISTKDRQAFS